MGKIHFEFCKILYSTSPDCGNITHLHILGIGALILEMKMTNTSSTSFSLQSLLIMGVYFSHHHCVNTALKLNDSEIPFYYWSSGDGWLGSSVVSWPVHCGGWEVGWSGMTSLTCWWFFSWDRCSVFHVVSHSPVASQGFCMWWSEGKSWSVQLHGQVWSQYGSPTALGALLVS